MNDRGAKDWGVNEQGRQENKRKARHWGGDRRKSAKLKIGGERAKLEIGGEIGERAQS